MALRIPEIRKFAGRRSLCSGDSRSFVSVAVWVVGTAVTVIRNAIAVVIGAMGRRAAAIPTVSAVISVGVVNNTAGQQAGDGDQ
jgi:hypothetical protein